MMYTHFNKYNFNTKQIGLENYVNKKFNRKKNLKKIIYNYNPLNNFFIQAPFKRSNATIKNTIT